MSELEHPITGRAAVILVTALSASERYSELVVLLAALLDDFAIKHVVPTLQELAEAGEDPADLLRGFARVVRLLADQYDPDQ